MALIECRYFSEVLGLSTSATVILPQRPETQIGTTSVGTPDPLPVLYLLHGMGDDHTAWTRRTSIERYVAELGLAVVMPNAHRSYYTDQVTGYDYFIHITEELPSLMGELFPLTREPAETFVAGLSMGGYGALKWAMRRPGSIAAAASLSGGLDVIGRPRTPEWLATFGSVRRAAVHGDDLLRLAETIDPAACPPLFQWCGIDDQNYAENTRFQAVGERRGLPLTYSDGPGDHAWRHWDEQIQRVLEWLPLRTRP